MIELPPIPAWDGLHPLIIHFPVALLMVAPLLIVAGLVLKKHREGLLLGALILMVLGTAATWVAVSTGEAAGRLADRSPEINAVLEHHEELAETTRAAFTVLTVVFAGLLAASRLLRKPPAAALQVGVLVGFLAVWSGATLILVNTAHNGGRLVHELGVRAFMPPSPLPVSTVDDDD